MSSMTMRERILAVIEGRPHDQIPLVMYENMLPHDEIYPLLGPEGIGLLRWTKIHRIEQRECASEIKEYYVEGMRWQRTTIHTPKGDLVEERAFEPVYDSSSVRKHFVEERGDYERFWAFLEDGQIVSDPEPYERAVRELGDLGLPLVSIDRTPYQQLWVEWMGLDNLGYHMADYADRVAHTVDLLKARAERTFEIARNCPSPFIDFPDNITAPAIGPRRFSQYCVPLYDRLADMLDGRDARVFVHMDGDLKPLWPAIAASKVGGLDSFAPAPDNDTTVDQAVEMWPEKRLFINFPSSVHLRSPEEIREVTDKMLTAGGHTGRLEIQISENVPPDVWRTSMPVIAQALIDFGAP